MLLHPLLSTLDDDYYYYNPRSYENMRRAMALEDIRRRAELERYYRAQNARRFRNHHPFGDDDVHQRLLQRQVLEREAERQDYHHALRFLRGDNDYDVSGKYTSPPPRHEDLDHNEEGPTHRLMRGPDGRIYRVPIQKTFGKISTSPLQQQMNETLCPPDTKPKHEELGNKVACRAKIPPEGSIESIPSMVTEQHENINRENKETNGLKSGVDTDTIAMMATKSTNHNKRTNKLATVIVEDASDNEEDDDFKSPWRNRRPSPGEWMEPVAIFDNMHR